MSSTRNLLRLTTISSSSSSSSSSPSLSRLPLPTTTTTPRTRPISKMAAQQQNTKFQGGASATHNPHPDFKQIEASRPPFDDSLGVRYTKTVDPDWEYGSGANRLYRGKDKGGAPPPPPHVSIDPDEPGRPASLNYKLLISGVVPRPVAFLSTRSADGSVANLAPFSYFNVVNHDPPLFVIGFAAAGTKHKDSLRCLLETGECVINIISESFLEAANATSVDAPYGASEWDVAGLTPLHDCRRVKAARVGEAVFSIEGTLDTYKEYESRRDPGRKTGVVATIEGRNFWVREDAVNEERSVIDPAVLRPIGRLGGITYGRVTEVLEIPRADWEKNIGGQEGYEKLKNRKR